MKNFIKKNLLSVVTVLCLFAGTSLILIGQQTMFPQAAVVWDNSKFIDDTFRSLNPDSGDIIYALYGSGDEGTAYTTNRSGWDGTQCSGTEMQVEYIGPGTSTIPLLLTGNTIYVLTGGNYITTGTINTKACVSIIGITGNITLYSSGNINKIIDISSSQFTILDYININGSGDGLGGNHDANDFGILHGSNNTTINNIKVYNNQNVGISFNYQGNNTINNSQIYNNNQNGIAIGYSNNNIINNSQIYNNNNGKGIEFFHASNNAINNSQFYNNSYGLYYNQSNNNIINNSISYNNSYGLYYNQSNNNIINNNISYNNSYGLYLISSSSNNIINNSQFYNNNFGIEDSEDSLNTTYYGVLKLFNNLTNTGLTTNTIRGTGTDLPYTSRTNGSIDITDTISLDHIVNPKNSNGDYLHNRSSSSSPIGIRSFVVDSQIEYSYGSQIITQIQPVIRSGITDIITGGSYVAGNFIGSNVSKILGSITIGTYTNTLTNNITFSPTTGPYLIFGDITTTITGTTLSSTIITLTGTDGSKYIITQLGAGINRATHYSNNITLDRTLPTFTGTCNVGFGGSPINNNGYYNVCIAFNIQFSDTNISGATINGNIYTGLSITGNDGTYTFQVTDKAGNYTGLTFTIDKIQPTITATSNSISLNSGNISTGTSISLSFSDPNISGATLTGPSGTSSYTTNQNLTLTLEGQYTITVTDKAGNSTGITFGLVPSLSCSSTLTGNMIAYSGNIPYTKDQAGIQFSCNKPINYTITGDISLRTSPIMLTANTPITLYPNLSGTDGQKGIYINLNTGTVLGILQNYSKVEIINLDTTGPSITLGYPNNGQTSGISGTFTISRTATDAGIGISGYNYYILSGTSIIRSGYTTSTSTTIQNYNITTSGTYNRYVQGKDKLGNTGNSATRSFNYEANIDTEPDSFSFDRIDNATADKSYISNEITIAGLTPNVPVLATIDNGALYISGIVVGQTGYVYNGNKVKIELISSEEIGTTVSSTLTIGGQYSRFRVTTEQEAEAASELSSTTKLYVATVFNTIEDLYADDKSRASEFMIIFKSMMEDQIDKLEDDNSLSSSEKRKLAVLNYLLELVDNYIDDNDISGEDIHTAPNGKRYLIVYDKARACYTSPNFSNTNKCFPVLSEMKSHINVNNPARNHTVDTTRSTPTYNAPNGKSYYIQKTRTGKYFSYRFIAPKYFNTLDEIKSYISKNNPKK